MFGFLDQKKSTGLAALIFLVVFPLLKSTPYVIHIFNVFFIWAIVAANWNLVLGYAGIWSMANVSFMVLGAYGSGIFSIHFGWHPFVSIPLSGLATMAVVTLFVGLPSLRLKGIYVALLSLMFGSTLPTLATQTRIISGGSSGLRNIPPLFEGITRIHSYYIHFSLFAIILGIVLLTIKSSSGKAFIALRDSPDLAKALGINEYKEKIKVFALTSMLTGIAGGFYAHYQGNVTPALLGIGPFILTFAMVQIGGIGKFPGGVLGAALLVFAGEWLRLFGTLRFALIGGMICIVILFFPGGLMQIGELLGERLLRFGRR